MNRPDQDSRFTPEEQELARSGCAILWLRNYVTTFRPPEFREENGPYIERLCHVVSCEAMGKFVVYNCDTGVSEDPEGQPQLNHCAVTEQLVTIR